MKKLLIILTVLIMPTISQAATGWFGNDSTLASDLAMDTLTCVALRESTAVSILVSTGETIDTLAIRARNNNASPTPKGVFGIYEYSAGIPTARVFISDTLTFTGFDSTQWFKVPCSYVTTSGKRYTIAFDRTYTSSGGPSVRIRGSVTGGISIDTSNALDDPFNNLSNANRMALKAHYTEASCTAPSQALTWIDSTTTSIKIQDVITGTFDSVTYWYNDDSTITDAAYITVADNDSTTHSINKTGLTANNQYMFWARGWNHVGADTCSVLDSVDTKTVYVAPAAKIIGLLKP